MVAQTSPPWHIELTETFVRFYVLLAQTLDRSVEEQAQQSIPEAELQTHLETTYAKLMDILSTNRVVKDKVKQEYDHVLSLAGPRQKAETSSMSLDQVKATRRTLQNKMIALSDLLAVLRAG